MDGLALRHTEVQLHLEQLRHELVLIEVPVAVEVDAREEVKQPLAALGEGGAHARRDLAGRGDADRLVHGVQPPPPRVARDSRALERGEVGVEVGVELGRGGAVRGVPALHRHLVLITDRLSCRREIFASAQRRLESIGCSTMNISISVRRSNAWRPVIALPQITSRRAFTQVKSSLSQHRNGTHKRLLTGYMYSCSEAFTLRSGEFVLVSRAHSWSR